MSHSIDMNRRDFLASATRVGLVAPFLDPLLDRSQGGFDPVPPEVLMGAIDAREAALLGFAPRLSRAVSVPAEVATDFTRDALHTLYWSSEFLGLPPPQQRGEQAQEALRLRAPQMSRTVLRGCGIVDTLSPQTLASVARQLADDPELGERIRGDVLAQAGALGMPEPIEWKLERVLDRTLWRLTHQHPELLRTRTLRSVDRVGHHLGVDWRDAARQVPLLARSAPFDPTRGQSDPGDPAIDRPFPLNRTQHVGLVLLGIQFGLGATGAIIGLTTASLVGAVMGTVAGVILGMAVFTLIVGAVRGW